MTAAIPHPQRQLKARETCHTYQLSQKTKDRTPIGEMHLKGHWLIQAGFAIDQAMTVTVTPGCLVLTADNAGK